MGPARKRLADVLACLTGEMGPSFKHFFAWPDAVHFQEGTITWTWTGRKPKAQYKNVTRTFPMVYESVDQLWDDLVSRDVLPEEWGGLFYTWEGKAPSNRPHTVENLASIAAYGKSCILTAEELVHDFNRRLFILGEKPLTSITWRGVCYGASFRENPWGFLRYPGLSAEVFYEWSKTYNNTPPKGPTNLVTKVSPKTEYRELMCGVGFWPKYLELAGLNKDTPNPFEPLRELYHLGFGLGDMADGKCTIRYTLLGP